MPDTLYKFTIVPIYGNPGNLKPQQGITFEIQTEKEFDKGHGVWFNRGAIASQAFARQFSDKPPSEPDNPTHDETVWLSRGLLDACLRFINDTPAGDSLRVAAYEFTYKPVLSALKAAFDRGVDVRIVYHDTSNSAGKQKGANETAINAASLPMKVGHRQVLFPRTKTKIPHNKFIVRLVGGDRPTHVWTGSTNFTPSGFLGQTNVGHLISDAETAKQFLAYWEVLKKDPDLEVARAGAMHLTPDPPPLIPEHSIVQVFSPRTKSVLLKWYGNRIRNAVGSLMFTAAFGVAKQLVPPLAEDCDYLRFILMEKPPTAILKATLNENRDCVISYGAVLGEMYTFKDGEPVARRTIKEFDLDKWFLKEEHYRRANEGFVFFIHTKFLLIDPLSDDPLVCSGSANFSSNSLLQNDENMLLIRGDTRVADIYLTEFDRIFRHFYFRDVANEIEAAGNNAEGAFLYETSKWTDSYFKPGAFKTRRREMFFADSTKSWVMNAAKDV
jgi:phosphatidylserine/phosphatidylglycerophosphate/cardiolipin synthase-like enzyme